MDDFRDKTDVVLASSSLVPAAALLLVIVFEMTGPGVIGPSRRRPCSSSGPFCGCGGGSGEGCGRWRFCCCSLCCSCCCCCCSLGVDDDGGCCGRRRWIGGGSIWTGLALCSNSEHKPCLGIHASHDGPSGCALPRLAVQIKILIDDDDDDDDDFNDADGDVDLDGDDICDNGNVALPCDPRREEREVEVLFMVDIGKDEDPVEDLLPLVVVLRP
jgi:hypothetical protein